MRISPRNTRQQSYRGGQGFFQQYQPQPQPQQIARHVVNISPLSGNRSPNSGTSSAYHDRHITIRLVCPCSNIVVCTRLNRVVPTAARAQNGAAVCEEYMYKQTCPLGEYCPKVHVAQEYTWQYITQDINKNTGLYEAGFFVQCYDPRMTRYYNIPSEFILPTRGSNEYVKMHNEHGANFKAKFKLCEAMTMEGKCDFGATCEDIHTVFEDLSVVESTTTHIAEPEMLMHYPRLRPDIIVRVFEQNSNESYVNYTGDQVLVTLGARQYVTAFDAEGTIPKKKMQHCAHFRTKHLCRMGENCRFLHVVSRLNSSLGNSLNSGITPHNVSRGDSPVSDITVNVRSRHAAQYINGSQVALFVAQKYGADSVYTGSGTPTEIDATGSLPRDVDRQQMQQPVQVPQQPQQQNSGESSPTAERSGATPAQTEAAKMRMISPTRRNNPYALTSAEERPAPPRTE
ncbi:hypothetical protein LSM04_009211 [Trypanosoma melophagium]|uniref:uncharacterized protein n=1 Tax=Trypanosoma melophagium TaxID=715481 RepID=UPI00351A3E15|nr:hypothetical protein LSM04_009211 [Trypanosoma melophagium]